MADASTVAAEMKRCLDIEHEVEVLQVRRHLHQLHSNGGLSSLVHAGAV